MRYQWLVWPLFAALMGFALGGSFVWGVLYSPPEQHASYNHQADQHPTQQEHKGGFWEKANEDPTAYFTLWLVAFTGVLAISTIGLWIVTWRASASQAHDMQVSIAVASRSADIAEKAMLSVEIPYLYPFIRRHGFITHRSGQTGQPTVTGFNYGNEFIEFYFKNFGRTPAEIIEVQSALLPSMGMPRPYPAWDDRVMLRLSGYIVGAEGGESRDFPYAFNRGMFETHSEGKFNPNTHAFWFLGFVRYKDVFENEYVRGFCLCYSPMTDLFYPVGDDGYNYRKKTKSAGQEAQNQTRPM